MVAVLRETGDSAEGKENQLTRTDGRTDGRTNLLFIAVARISFIVVVVIVIVMCATG